MPGIPKTSRSKARPSKQRSAKVGSGGSEERFQVTLNSIGDAVIATDLEGRVTFMNAVAERLTGWKQCDAQGLPLEQPFNITDEFTGNPMENPVSQVLREGNVIGLANHAVLTAVDGTKRPIEDSAAPIRDVAGRLLGIVLVFRDVSRQREAEIAKARLAAIVEGSDDAIIGKDLRGIVTSWNQGAERIFGYSAREMINQPITRIIPAERQDEERQILSRLKRGERIDHFETVRVTKDGRYLDISLTVSPIKDSYGQIIGASKIARDVTDRKAFERALRDAQQQLQAYAQDLEKRVGERTVKLQEMVGELERFSYTISHDVRAPLRAMRQYSHLLLQEHANQLDQQARGFLQRIIDSGERLEGLIAAVLGYSRSLRVPVEMEPINLEKLLKDIIEDFPMLHPDRAHIRVQSPLLLVSGHQSLLSQCLSNLLSNAVKFVAPNRIPEVRLWTEARGEKVRLVVEDNGIGIPAEHHEHIFGIFERVPGDKEYEGTGIGLAIVRKALERMGGTVGLESAPGQGSKFWIELPTPDMAPHASL